MTRLLAASLLCLSLVARAHDEAACEHGDGAKACTHAAAAAAPASVPAKGVLARGAPLPKDRKAVPLADVLEAPRDGEVVLVEGVVRRACTRMGCWMELAPTSGGAGVRVTFEQGGFLVPTDSAGARARVAGRLNVVPLSPEQAAHLRSEGATVPSSATTEVRLLATGVELSRS